MKQITVAIAGLGSRGKDTYAQVAKLVPDKMKIVAVADINEDEKISIVDLSILIKLMQNKDVNIEVLTPKEKEVLALVAKGASNQEIADKLFLSNGTVRNYISVILEKTGLEHRTQIAVKYLKG